MVFELASRIEDIRVRVYFNSNTSTAIETPFCKSVNITRQRGQAVSSASITLRADADSIKDLLTMSSSHTAPALGDFWNDINSIVIQAQEKESNTGWVTLFTGIIKSLNIRAELLYPNMYAVDIQASDIFAILESRTFTRRVKLNGMGVFAVITGLVRKSIFGRSRSHNTRSGRFGGRGASGVSIEGGGGIGGSSYKKRSKKSYGKSAVNEPRPEQESLEEGISPSGVIKSFVKIGNRSPRMDRGHWVPRINPDTNTEPGANATLVVIPQTILMQAEETQVFKCLSEDVCQPGDASDYTWTMSDRTVGEFIEGGATTYPVNNSNPATQGVTYRHTVVGKTTNQIILTDNVNNLIGTATVIGFPIHPHASLGDGGPAYGTYAPTTDED